VLMKVVDQGEGTGGQQNKKLKVVTPQETIEVEPVSSSSSSLSVRVNSQRVLHNSDVFQQQGDSAFSTVRFTNPKKSEVEVHTKEVTVRFNGRKAWVRLSAVHKHTHCGLCGHSGAEKENHSGESHEAYASLHRSYSLQQDEECSKEEVGSFYGGQLEDAYKRSQAKSNKKGPNRDSSSSQSSSQQEEEGEMKPVKMTKMIEYNHKVCFSKSPVKQCPEGSSPATNNQGSEEKQAKVQFTCLQRSSTEARQMARLVRRLGSQARNGEGGKKQWQQDSADLAQQLTDQQTSFAEVVTVPKSCVANGDY